MKWLFPKNKLYKYRIEYHIGSLVFKMCVLFNRVTLTFSLEFSITTESHVYIYKPYKIQNIKLYINIIFTLYI